MQLAEEVAQIGASLSTGTSRDATTVSTSSLSRNFPAALALVADVALRPSFPSRRSRARSRDAACRSRRAARQPGSGRRCRHRQGAVRHASIWIQRDWNARVEQAADARGSAGILAPALRSRQRRARRHRRDYGSRAEKAGGDRVRQLAYAALPRPRSLACRRAAPPRLVIVDRPGSPQTQLRVATFGVPRSSPDYVPVRVMNTILGGMFASRINMNLREEHGYTYGANSQFPFWRSGGPFSVATGVRTDVTAPAVHEVMLELKRMSETRVTPQELTLAKDAITLQLPALFETNDRTADKPVDALHARAAAELLLESRRADFGRRRASRAGRREEIPAARQVRGRGSRRPLEDRRRPRERARNEGGNQGRGRRDRQVSAVRVPESREPEPI